MHQERLCMLSTLWTGSQVGGIWCGHAADQILLSDFLQRTSIYWATERKGAISYALPKGAYKLQFLQGTAQPPVKDSEAETHRYQRPGVGGVSPHPIERCARAQQTFWDADLSAGPPWQLKNVSSLGGCHNLSRMSLMFTVQDEAQLTRNKTATVSARASTEAPARALRKHEEERWALCELS